MSIKLDFSKIASQSKTHLFSDQKVDSQVALVDSNKHKNKASSICIKMSLLWLFALGCVVLMARQPSIDSYTEENKQSRIDRVQSGINKMAGFSFTHLHDDLDKFASEHYDNPEVSPLGYRPRSNKYHRHIKHLGLPDDCRDILNFYASIDDLVKSFSFCEKSQDFDVRRMKLEQPKYMKFMRVLRACEEAMNMAKLGVHIVPEEPEVR